MHYYSAVKLERRERGGKVVCCPPKCSVGRSVAAVVAVIHRTGQRYYSTATAPAAAVRLASWSPFCRVVVFSNTASYGENLHEC